MKYIGEAIGAEYKTWGKGETVFITSPTGTGKTSFVINQLLPYAIEMNKGGILYLVNRTALKQQVEKAAEPILLNYREKAIFYVDTFFEVKTYQSIEQEINSGRIDGKSYRWIVCDESHYFLSDSLFNTNTILSFNYVLNYWSSSTIIFMSATMKRFREIAEGMISGKKTEVANNSGAGVNAKNKEQHMYWSTAATLSSNQKHTRNYSVEKQYDYIDILTFHDIESISALILDSKSKWLIFYNDIRQGKKLAEKLNNMEIDAIFIDSKYEAKEDTVAAINELTEDRKMKHDVIIATSALDNGISIEDEQLRNLVVMTDTEEEFIQMIGRKRTDGKRVKLYLYAGEKAEFRRRKSVYDRAEEGRKKISRIYSVNDYNATIQLFVELLSNPRFYEDCRKLIIPRYIGAPNTSFLNLFSCSEINHRVSLYYEILKRLEEKGSSAFLEMQCEWLGLEMSQIQEVIMSGSDEEKAVLKKNIADIMEPYLGEIMSERQNKDLKMAFREDLRSLLQQYGAEKKENLHVVERAEFEKKEEALIKAVFARDRIISSEAFNSIMEIVDMPYRMNGGGQGKKKKEFVIEKINK